MSAVSKARRYIQSLPKNQMFSTRELLNFGRRGTIDQLLSRMVKEGYIVRLARGIFMLIIKDIVIPTIREISDFKAKAFRKATFEHGKNVAKDLGLIFSVDFVHLFSTNGKPACFKLHLHEAVVRLVPNALRKLHAGDSAVGRAIRCLWHLGKKRCTPEHVEKVTMTLSREENEQLKNSASELPSWLVDLIVQTE